MPGPTTQAYSSAPLRNIKKVQFGVLSPEELVSQVGLGKLKALEDIKIYQILSQPNIRICFLNWQFLKKSKRRRGGGFDDILFNF